MIGKILAVLFALFAGVVLLIVLVIARLYASFRGMCRGVREDLKALLKAEHPEIEVVREWQGNLLLKRPERGEFVWPLSDVYTAIGAQPGMGRNRAAREIVYRQALAALGLGTGASEPASPEAWRNQVRPQLLAPGDAAALGAAVARTPIPALGLTTVYTVGRPHDGHYVTEPERDAHALDQESLHRLAVANLRATFPRELLGDSVAGRAGAGVQLGDHLDAARLLVVPELLADGESVVAVARQRDLLLLLPASVADDRSRMAEALASLDDHGHPPLLDRAVRVTRDGFTLA